MNQNNTMTRKELEEALEDWTVDKTKCTLCSKPLKNHSKLDLDKCFDKMIDAEREGECYEF